MPTKIPNPARTSGATISSWFGTAPALPPFAPLAEDTTTDVVVVGGGIAGLTTAYLLSKEGHKVLLLEDGELASGESGRTTAHLSYALDDRYTTLENLFGREGAQLAAESHASAIDKIEQIVQDEQIDCDFTRLDGFLFLHADGTHQELMEERDAAHRAGLPAVEWLPNAGTTGFEPGECLRWPGQGQFHILKYLTGLTQAIVLQGGRICTRTHVSEVHGGPHAHIVTEDGILARAKRAIVVATNTPFNDRVVMHTKQHPYRTYVVGARVPKGSVTKALYWDLADPYHYVRLQEVPAGPRGGQTDYDLLIVGGEDHKTGQTDDPSAHLRCLEEWTRDRFPMVKDFEYRWSGQVMEPTDGLGYAGRNPLDADNVFIITGDSGHGMTHGTLGPMVVADLLAGRDNAWAKLYDPGRITLKRESAQEYLKENLNVAIEYTDLLTGGDVNTVEEIPNGSGAVMRRGITKIAVYKDEKGAVHECSAICPHLHCVVHWNGLEKSWDCPCHGSRFTALGELLNGPANTGLAPA
ncbi:FAD-dependent oxidoreductase [Hymenobacter sp. BT770]|uniref:FAD-dependent oxidoreductase n=1 Tax=Hymenobacter sp. BT770 TaxID=2886942 RepID=UPI001D10645A|nr:FAD-dependent oxidoreductase [Hymenobacter sp. BT770]MCC3154900.1 FAD-dependent oxidoreductase [Hymenobacter sp. BT770]MDO3417350.1 FAD-dependent oxidoreductase [Hymenobacter sp. BT770]